MDFFVLKHFGMSRRLFKEIFKNNSPRWLVLIIDLYIIINTLFLAYLIRFNFQLNFDISNLFVQIPFVVGVALLSFLIVGSYKGVVRHTGVRDSFMVSVASLLLFLLLSVIVNVNNKFEILPSLSIPMSILTIHFLLNGFVLISSRFLFKEIYNLLQSDLSIKKRILIYGAGESGLITQSVLAEDKENNSFVVAFIDDNKKISSKHLNGLKVYHSSVINDEFIDENNIDEIILSIRRIPSARLLEIVDNISKLSVKLKIVPPAKSWIDNNLNLTQIKELNIEDLLGRKSIEVNNPILKKEFNHKTILITGAAGSIGSEISRQISNFDYTQIVLVDQAESDLYNLQQHFKNKELLNIISVVANVTNRRRMESIFMKYRPNIVFHAAAYKHVPFMEKYPIEAVRVNVCGTRIMSELALQFNTEKFVLVSTDKAVNPTNVMGATKRIAEIYINCLKEQGRTKFITTRFGNVLGSNGSVIPLFKSQIERGGPITVTHKEITRYFMTIPEACQLVLEAGAMGEGGEIFVFDMGASIKIYDLALKMIQLSGLKYPDDIDIKLVGLRPGEKIYEELLAKGENTTATYHEEIMIAKIKRFDEGILKNKILKLCSSIKELNDEDIVIKIKEIVPEFISNNSEYEKLDKIEIDK